MKKILIVIGIVLMLAGVAEAEKLNVSNIVYVYYDFDHAWLEGYNIQDLISVTTPDSKKPYWTIVAYDPYTKQNFTYLSNSAYAILKGGK
jgi:hypothetical protein